MARILLACGVSRLQSGSPHAPSSSGRWKRTWASTKSFTAQIAELRKLVTEHVERGQPYRCLQIIFYDGASDEEIERLKAEAAAEAGVTVADATLWIHRRIISPPPRVEALWELYTGPLPDGSSQRPDPSTLDQEAGYQAQIKALKAHGCEKVFAEQVSSVGERQELEAALEYAREGDAIVVTKLDRLARSVSHLISIGDRLEAKGVALKVLDQAIDTSTPTGRLMFNMLGAIAQFERELMLERQREGVAKAKAEGKCRAPTARAKAAEVRRLHGESVGPTEIAKRLRISRASVYRVLADVSSSPPQA